MNRHPFAAFGILTLVLNPLLFPITVFYTVSPSSTLITRGLILSAATALVGIGLIFRRKWAALYFSVPLFVYGVTEAYLCIEELHFPYNLLMMGHGLSLTFPLVVMIRTWKDLTWGRRFF